MEDAMPLLRYGAVLLIFLSAAIERSTLKRELIPIATCAGVTDNRVEDHPAPIVDSDPRRPISGKTPASTKLTASDTIVLALFTNSTGEESFDDTLGQVLRTALDESPFLTVIPVARIAATLEDMAQPRNARLTPELARSVCQRVHSKAYIAGSINRHGPEFMIGLQAQDCESGETLAQAQSTARGKETILDTLGAVVSKLRVQLGEPAESVRTFSTPLSRATSSSFEALRAWDAGIRAQQEKGDAAALPFFEKTIELDPSFASALLSIGAIYRNTSQEGRAREFDAKAFAKQDRASVRDRFRISGLYYSFVTVEYKKAEETYGGWIRSYPRDQKAVMGLGAFYGDVCRYEESVAQFSKARQMNPDDVIAHDDLIEMLTATGQFAKVREAALEMQRLKLDDDTPHIFMYSVSVLEHDTQEMARQAAWFEGKPRFQHELFSEHADAEAYTGHLARARELTQQAVQSALAANNKEQAAGWQLNSAWREELFGNRREAHRQAIHALTIAPQSREGEAVAAILLARTGDTRKADDLAKDLERRYPLHAVIQSYWLPCIRAQIDLAMGHFASALQELEKARAYDTLFPQVTYYSHMPSVVLRAEAYLALGQSAAAAGEWETILRNPGIVQLSATAPTAKLQLARAIAQAGTDNLSARTKARIAYQEFLSLWKDADHDIPILTEAQAEFANLE
jgi:hypothetical protein